MNNLYINLKSLSHNITQIKNKLNSHTKIMAIIKASGYGSGAAHIAHTLIENGIEFFGVATVFEAIELRKSGVDLPILILDQLFPQDIEKVIEFDLTANVCSFDISQQINVLSNSSGKKTKIHIEVDTGMNRTGLAVNQAVDTIIRINQLDSIIIEGLFTHFACADSSREYTLWQIDQFETLLAELKSKGIEIPIKHACNSAGLLNFPQAHFDMVRPGIMLYGYYPSKNLKDQIDLIPCFALKSQISYIKKVPKGTSISYNSTYVTSKPSTIATIPIGYADGYRRCLSNKGHVMIGGQKANIVGNICMDMFMIDVTHIPDAKTGDEVILFDENNITVDEIADLCGTINYEIISTVGQRVERKYM
jgi:alanine racemase